MLSAREFRNNPLLPVCIILERDAGIELLRAWPSAAHDYMVEINGSRMRALIGQLQSVGTSSVLPSNKL